MLLQQRSDDQIIPSADLRVTFSCFFHFYGEILQRGLYISDTGISRSIVYDISIYQLPEIFVVVTWSNGTGVLHQDSSHCLCLYNVLICPLLMLEEVP